MQKLENAKGQLKYTINMAMKTLVKAILLIPDIVCYSTHLGNPSIYTNNLFTNHRTSSTNGCDGVN